MSLIDSPSRQLFSSVIIWLYTTFPVGNGREWWKKSRIKQTKDPYIFSQELDLCGQHHGMPMAWDGITMLLYVCWRRLHSQHVRQNYLITYGGCDSLILFWSFSALWWSKITKCNFMFHVWLLDIVSSISINILIFIHKLWNLVKLPI